LSGLRFKKSAYGKPLILCATLGGEPAMLVSVLESPLSSVALIAGGAIDMRDRDLTLA